MLRPLIPRACAVAVAVLGGALASQAPAHACTIDQKPSVYANGVRAQVNPVTPTSQAQMLTWTYFVFVRHYATHRPIALTEDRRQLSRVLMPSALRVPWTWQLGDGHVAHGWSVRHAYAHPGRYAIGVYAYNPESGQWDLFDRVTIVVAS